MTDLQIAKKALDAADEAFQSLHEIFDSLKYVRVDSYTKKKLEEKTLDFAAKMSSYKTMRELIK